MKKLDTMGALRSAHSCFFSLLFPFLFLSFGVWSVEGHVWFTSTLRRWIQQRKNRVHPQGLGIYTPHMNHIVTGALLTQLARLRLLSDEAQACAAQLYIFLARAVFKPVRMRLYVSTLMI